VFEFAQWLVSDWEKLQLEKLPETFPKAVKEDSLGSWLANMPGPPPVIPDGTSHADSAANLSSDNQPTGVRAASTGVRDAEPGNAPPPRRERSFKRTNRATICVDLDGVLAARADGDAIGPPIDGAVEFTRELSTRGSIVIFTARFSTRSGKARSPESTHELESRIAEWLNSHGFSYDSINTSQAKPIASAYIDDRAVSCQPLKQGLDAFDTALSGVDKLCTHG